MGAATLILMASFVGSRLLGLLRDIAIGQTFGTSADLDAYLAAFRVPDTLFQLLAGAALGSGFIPVFTAYLARGEVRSGWLLANSLLNAITAAILVASTAAALLAPALVGWIAPGFTPDQLDLATELTRIMLISPIIFGASGLVMAILNARQHFLWPAIAPMTYNLAILIAAVFFGERFGVRALAIGVAAGAVGHLVVQLPELYRQGLRYRPVIAWRLAGFREVVILMGPRVLGLAAVQINFLVTTNLASGLAPGSLAALNYAYLIMMAPLGIFGMAIATAVFPSMAEQAALARYDRVRAMLAEALRMILFLTIPAIAFLVVAREPVVGLLFQRGAFDDASRMATAYALIGYAIGLAGHATIEITTRVFYAFHDTRTPVTLAIVSMIGYVLIGRWLIGPFDVAGPALALSIVAMLEGVALLVLAGKRLGSIEGRALGRSLAQIGPASIGLAAIAAIGGYVGGRIAEPPLAWWIAVGIGAGLGGPVYLGYTWLTGSPELRLLVGQFARRLGRRI